MDGWTNERKDGRMEGWMIDGWMNGWMVNKWMDGWTNEGMDGR